MIGYRIVREEERCFFELIPGNNNNQPIGRSKYYNDVLECRKGVQRFRDFVLQNNIKSVVSPFVMIDRALTPYGTNGFVYQYIYEDEILFCSRVLEQKNNCNKMIASNFKKIESYALNEIAE